jgi:hypothetical protein
LHRTAVGVQVVQALEMQAPGEQFMSLPQLLPVASHVCRVLVSLHRGAFGVQTVQEPERQAPDEHARLLPQLPLRSHVCCVVGFKHCVSPGTHMPAQSPVAIEQRYGQTDPLCQLPLTSHV